MTALRWLGTLLVIAFAMFVARMLWDGLKHWMRPHSADDRP